MGILQLVLVPSEFLAFTLQASGFTWQKWTSLKCYGIWSWERAL